MAVQTLSTWIHRTSLWCTPHGWMKPLREEAGVQRRRRTGQGLRQRERTPKKLHLKRQAPLGCWDRSGHEPPHNWGSWKGVQPWDGQDGWQMTLKLMRSRSFTYYRAYCYKTDKPEIFHCFCELISFEWTRLRWLSEIAKRQDNQEGKRRRIRRIWKKYVAEEVNTVSIC